MNVRNVIMPVPDLPEPPDVGTAIHVMQKGSSREALMVVATLLARDLLPIVMW